MVLWFQVFFIEISAKNTMILAFNEQHMDDYIAADATYDDFFSFSIKIVLEWSKLEASKKWK